MSHTDNEKYLQAKKRVEKLKAFYIHLVVYILVNILLFMIDLFDDSSNFWFFWPLFGWGIGLASHAISTFVGGSFGRNWEERKIQQYMDEDK